MRSIQGLIAVAALCVGAFVAALMPAAPAHGGGGGGGGTSVSYPFSQARVLADVDNVVDITGVGGTGQVNAATSGVVFFLGTSIGAVGSVSNRTIGQTAAGFYDTAGAANLFTVDGVGITATIIGVTANNNLAGTAACAAIGNVGETVLYSDTGSSKITFCMCEQTAAATFAWGPVTGAGDCT